MSNPLDLERLPQLQELFRRFSNGVHLNRASDAALWAELEHEQDAYSALFDALGYELRIDGRGFAWFHGDDAGSNVSNQSRQLALLFMVIFDVQADAGQPLGRFDAWRIDSPLLETVLEAHHEVLTAEGLDKEALEKLLRSAESLGFTRRQSGYWELLPAVCRYLDHFQALTADESSIPMDENGDTIESDTDNDGDDSEDAP